MGEKSKKEEKVKGSEEPHGVIVISDISKLQQLKVSEVANALAWD